jgi:hypothetical protein
MNKTQLLIALKTSCIAKERTLFIIEQNSFLIQQIATTGLQKWKIGSLLHALFLETASQ